MGRLIPAGTGLPKYKDLKIHVEGYEEEEPEEMYGETEAIQLLESQGDL